MHSIIHLLAILLLALTVAGNPVHLSKKSVTVDQVLRPRIPSEDVNTHRGLAAYAKAMGKFGASEETVRHLSALALQYGDSESRSEQSRARSSSVRRAVPSAITSSEGGQVSVVSVVSAAPVPSAGVAGPLTTIPGLDDDEYDTQITIGDRVFWIDFDTGSSDLWVFGPNITGLQPNQTLWHESATSTQLLGYSFYVSYGDGSYASGPVFTDQVILGSVKIPKATVEVANYAGGTFNAPSSGILGLGFDQNNEVYPVQQKTIFTDLIEQGLISQPVLSTDLKHDAPGCYTFGEIPWWQYSGGITYAPVDQGEGYWMFQPLGFGIGGNSSMGLNTSTQANQLLRGVLDTGTTLILVDDRIANSYWAQVSSAILDYTFFGGWIFDCSELLPDFKLLVGGTGKATYIVTVPGQFLNYAALGSGLCYGALQPTFGQIPFNIYGDVLLKSAFVVFDRGSDGQTPRVGFAAKSGN